MSLVMLDGERQIDFVTRTLHEQGVIGTFDVLYRLRDDSGRARSITRLAAVIHTLRHERGWVIDESHDDGGLAVYRVVSRPGPGRAVGRSRLCPGCRREHPVGTACALVLS